MVVLEPLNEQCRVIYKKVYFYVFYHFIFLIFNKNVFFKRLQDLIDQDILFETYFH